MKVLPICQGRILQRIVKSMQENKRHLPNNTPIADFPNGEAIMNTNLSKERLAHSYSLFDSAVWHCGGLASDKRSCWSVYSIYSPSFMKPYFWFPTMFGEAFGKQLDPTLRRLFHYNPYSTSRRDARVNYL